MPTRFLTNQCQIITFLILKSDDIIENSRIELRGIVLLASSNQIRGLSGVAKVLGKLSVPGCPTSLDDSRARAYCTCNRCGWGLFGHFFLPSIFSLFFLPLFGRRPDID